jgi:pyrimidine-specific ribonucleoside hydrolase
LGVVVVSLLTLGTGVTASTRPANSQRVSVVVDTDLGSDDLIALVDLLSNPRVDVKAVTVSGTGLVECPSGAREAAELLSALGHTAVPVACGQSLPLTGGNAVPTDWRRAADSMFGLTLPASTDTPRASAVALLTDTINGSPGSLTVVELAPMTNLGEALRLHPDLAKKIRAVVAMGGAFAVPGNSPGDGSAETNIWVDPTAARIVLKSGAPLTLVPLDATNQVPVTTFFAQALKRYHFEAPGATIVWDLMLATSMDRGGQYFWDPLAAFTTTDRPPVTIDHRNVAISATGKTTVAASGSRVEVVTHVDPRAFERALLSVLLDNRPFSIPPHKVTATLTYNGRNCTYQGAQSVVAGQAAFDTDNTSGRPFIWVAGRLDGRHTFADLKRYALNPRSPTSTPSWFTLDFTGTTPPHSTITWLPTFQLSTTGSTVVACATQAPPWATLAFDLTVEGQR